MVILASGNVGAPRRSRKGGCGKSFVNFLPGLARPGLGRRAAGHHHAPCSLQCAARVLHLMSGKQDSSQLIVPSRAEGRARDKFLEVIRNGQANEWSADRAAAPHVCGDCLLTQQTHSTPDVPLVA